MKTIFSHRVRRIAFFCAVVFAASTSAFLKDRIAAQTQVAGQNNEAIFKSLQFRALGPAIMGGRIDDFAVVESNPSTIFAATASGGLWKTTNNGTTWEPIFDNESHSSIGDVAIVQSNPDIIWAGTGEPNNRQSSSWGNGVYKSTDGGTTWTKLTGGLPEGDAGRIGLDVYRKDSKVVYLTYEHATESGIYRSDDKGATWKKMSVTNPRPMYYSQIRIDPANDQRLYVLGASWYVSDNGGKSFQNNPFTRIHGDYHALWINPANANHLLAGSDGGIHFSYDRGKTWDYVNTIPLGQFYEVGFDFRKPYWVYGGLQDNGSWGAPIFTTNFTGVSNDEWIRVGGGDGFYNVVDPKDPNTVYTESQNGVISRLNLKSGEAKFIRPQPEEGSKEQYRFDWNSPIVISPHNNQRIYLGGNRLFISNDRGDNWIATPDLTKNIDRGKLPIMGVQVKANVLSGHDGQDNYSQIVTLAESPAKEGVLWAGTDDGNVQVSRDGGKSWKNVVDRMSGVPANTYVTRVIASRTIAGRAYVTFDGHRNDDFKPYVFVTEDFGESWKAIANNLPHPANVIREHHRNPNLLLAGTEFGLWVSHNRGASWMQFKSNLPTVPEDDIQIHPRDNDLILATHGRSIYVLDDMTALEQMTETIAAAEAHLFDIRPATMWRQYNHKGSTGHKTFIAANPPVGAIIAYSLREKAKDKARITIHDKSGAQIRDLTVTNETGVQRILWDCRYQSPLPGMSQAPNTNSNFSGAGVGVFARGPRVLPGEYTAKLWVDGREIMAKPVVVEEDPRIELSPADAKSRLDFFLAVNKLQKSGTDAQNRVNGLRAQLNSLAETLKKQETKPEVLVNAVGEVTAQVIGLQNRVMPQLNRGPMASENAGPADEAAQAMQTAVMPQISRLFNMLDSYTEPVAPKYRDQLQRRTIELNALIEQINKLVTETVPNLNKQVEAAGLAPVKAGETVAPVQ